MRNCWKCFFRLNINNSLKKLLFQELYKTSSPHKLKSCKYIASHRWYIHSSTVTAYEHAINGVVTINSELSQVNQWPSSTHKSPGCYKLYRMYLWITLGYKPWNLGPVSNQLHPPPAAQPRIIQQHLPSTNNYIISIVWVAIPVWQLPRHQQRTPSQFMYQTSTMTCKCTTLALWLKFSTQLIFICRDCEFMRFFFLE